MKLFFYLPILANNNLLLKIYCKNIVVGFLNCHFLFFILFFLSFIHMFFFLFSFFFFLFSCFSPSCTYTHSYLNPPFFFYFFPFLLDSKTFLSLSFINLERKARLGTVNAVVNVSSRGERREKESFFIELYDFFLNRKIHLELLQYSLDQDNYCSNFKKILEKFCF